MEQEYPRRILVLCHFETILWFPFFSYVASRSNTHKLSAIVISYYSSQMICDGLGGGDDVVGKKHMIILSVFFGQAEVWASGF